MGARKTIAVLGGGSAGFTAARTAARLGARVLLFMGDDAARASLCVNRGCMPSKALFEPIDSMHHARRLGLLRVEPLRSETYLADLVSWKDREIARFRAFRQHAICQKESDDFMVVRRSARFVDPHTLASGNETYKADAVIITSGSVPARPPIAGLSELGTEIWTSDDILSNTVLPRSLILIGAGAIGLEFAQRYARLGCAVTVIARSRPFSHYPVQFGERLAEIYEREGIRVLCDTETKRVTKDIEGLYVVDTDGPHGFEPVAAERVMVATGRRPAVDGLALDKASIDLDARGKLTVGEDLRVTNMEHIFAAGDVIGRRMVVHQAHIEAGIAAENAVRDEKRTWSCRADLQVVFTDPEFAYAGLTAETASAAGHDVVSAGKESRLVGKLHLGGDDLGFAELIADASSHELLGAGLLCHGASDMIHLPAYMIAHGHTVKQGVAAEYYHPTRIEIVSSILDRLCSRLGGHSPRRADETSG